MKNILLKGPALSYSEYGDLCREVLSSLRENEEVDIFLINTGWGNSGWICNQGEFREYIDSLILKTSAYISEGKPHFDLCYQVDSPSAWKRMAPLNVGVTLGSMTTEVPEEFHQGCDIVDKIVVNSEIQKSTFLEKHFDKIEIIPRQLGDKIVKSKSSILNIDTDFNFLCSYKWEPKNNLEQALTSFFQEFQNEEVGLILNTYIKSRSCVDRNYTVEHMRDLMSLFPKNRKCKAFVLHGDVGENIFSDPKVSAYLDIRHTMEHSSSTYNALRAGLPIISSKWGTTHDFESGNHFIIDSKIENLKDRHIFNTQSDMELKWDYPEHDSVRDNLRKVYNTSGNRNYKLFNNVKNKNLKFFKKMNYNKLTSNLIKED